MGFSVSNLSCARGGLAVLADVSFDVAAGTALILRGPNGIGKTTLLRTIAGLQPALGGSIDIPADQVAYAGHADGIKSALTVAENLQFWAGVFGTTGVAPAIKAFNLTALKDRTAASLSAGQKRRLGLARLLVTGRTLWILDEPTVSLDADSTALFAQAIREHLKGGGSALLATHIDLGLEADTLDLTPFKATKAVEDGFHEAFL
ncbi:heme ABC exporter ATP-binding protein CcmA [Algirhabdus cladophorae]|uniref:heme ABC exporter ATP-binding protein CcmA n=1 Tax=Algirhabdus cladophorae TaxID=3377108 RepID=UPI003B847F8F